MATTAELQAAIDAIDAQLNTGVKQGVADGRSASFDIEGLERQRARLARQLAGGSASQFVKVVMHSRG